METLAAPVRPELPFPGFKEHVCDPFKQSDPRSFARLKRLFLDVPSQVRYPYSILIQKLTGKHFPDDQAREHWIRILAHKKDIEVKLGRIMGIQAVTVDYFDQMANGGPTTRPHRTSYRDLEPQRNARSVDSWVVRAYTPGYHIERLREEVLRAKRYNHALSAILMDIDKFHCVNERLSYETGNEILTIIVKIVKKTIRMVDIVTRYTGDRFLIILPNTNHREACELAERLRRNVHERTRNIDGLAEGVTATLSTGQHTEPTGSSEFIKFLENTLEAGKKRSRDAVYGMES